MSDDQEEKLKKSAEKGKSEEELAREQTAQDIAGANKKSNKPGSDGAAVEKAARPIAGINN